MLTAVSVAERCQDPRWRPHVRRYIDSFEVVERLYAGGPIIDIGGASPFTDLLRERYGDRVRATGSGDLRACDTVGCDAGTAGLVTCLEVIEHLKDPPMDDREVWTGGAVAHVLKLIVDALRPGGILVLTTPNVTGWIALSKLIHGIHPFTWAPHPRELAPADVRTRILEAGLVIREWSTRAVWDRHGLSEHYVSDLTRSLQPFGFSPVDREDCLFVVAVKP